jgi:hypothetical protein
MPRNHKNDSPDLHGGRLRVPRSRGAFSGVLLVLLGGWGVLVPFIGPYLDFGYAPDKAWHLSAGRFWLEVLPGAAAFVGGLLLLIAADRIITVIGAWLAVAGGGWFVVGPTLRSLLHLGAIGVPIHKTTLGSTMETLLLFTGIGALILFLGALALGRLSVVSVRDVRAAQRRAQTGDADAEVEAQSDQQRPTQRRHVAGSGDPAPTDTSGATSLDDQPAIAAPAEGHTGNAS